MTTINNLSSVDQFTGGDLIPLWSSSNSDARKGAISLLLSYMQANLTFPAGYTDAQARAAIGAALLDSTTIDLNFDGTNFTASLLARRQTVTYNANITLDLNLYDKFDITLTGNTTINFTGGTETQKILLRIKQDNVGSRLVTWGTSTRFGTDLTSITLTTTVNKTDYVGLINNLSASKVDIVSLSRGF